MSVKLVLCFTPSFFSWDWKVFFLTLFYLFLKLVQINYVFATMQVYKGGEANTNPLDFT
jgi:hypothetical protein